MRFLFLLSAIFSATTSFAATYSQFFFGGRAIVMITAKDPMGRADDDGERMFKGMNVEEQDSVIGPGKGIVSTDRDFNLSCAIRQGVGTECSIVVNSSGDMKIDEAAGRIEYRATLEKADVLSAKFLLDEDGKFDYETHDGKVIIMSRPGSFKFIYSK
jgi:hypothetical protein